MSVALVSRRASRSRGFPSPAWIFIGSLIGAGHDEDDADGMSMLEHLGELRHRLVVSVVAVAAGMVVATVPLPGKGSLTHLVLEALAQPALGSVVIADPVEGIVAYIQVAVIIALTLGMPILVYQGLAFVVPGLYDHERRYLYLAVPGTICCFATGIAFGHFVVVPTAIQFMLKFNGEVVAGVGVQWIFARYLDTVATLLFWMGIAFETPLIVFSLAKLRVVSVQRLAAARRYVFVGAFVAGAMITPTPDPLNQTLVSLPIYLLYELGVQISRLLIRPGAATA
ncbi:MAG: twin-arginine translocase subunit TatC [Chloroflexota bacterium]